MPGRNTRFPTGVNVSGRYPEWPVFRRPLMAYVDALPAGKVQLGEGSEQVAALCSACECRSMWTPFLLARFNSARVANRLQLYVRPVNAGLVPAGPDGISRSAPHSLNGLGAQPLVQARRIAVFTCLPSHLVVPCATFNEPVGHFTGRTNVIEFPGDDVRVRPPARARRIDGRSAVRTPGHGPAAPRSYAPSCSPVLRRRRSLGGG